MMPREEVDEEKMPEYFQLGKVPPPAPAAAAAPNGAEAKGTEDNGGALEVEDDGIEIVVAASKTDVAQGDGSEEPASAKRQKVY